MRNRSIVRRAASLDTVRLFQLPGNPTGRRQLTFAETPSICPFPIKRVYWLHNLDESEVRGGHAHRQLSQLIISVSGAFEIELDDCESKRAYRLESADMALIIPPMIWRTIRVLRPHSCLLVLASRPFEETDYIRDYREFVRAFRLAVPIPIERSRVRNSSP